MQRNKAKKAPKFTFTPVPEKVVKKVVQQRVNVDRLYRGRWTVQEPEPEVPKVLKKKVKSVNRISKTAKKPATYSRAPSQMS